MRNLIWNFRTDLDTKLGRCATCMRQSLAAALAAWALFTIVTLLQFHGAAQAAAALAALGLTIVWLLHVGSYARRSCSGVDAAGRRRALVMLANGAIAGAAVSVPVLLWSAPAFAFCGQCTRNQDCGTGYVCRNTAAVNSGKVCNECVKS